MSIKTRAAILEAPGRIVLGERTLELKEDEVLVKTHLSGVCGSDKTIYRGDIPEKISLPFYIGHEGGGTVVEVGSRVREYRVGDRVMAFNWCNTFADYFKVPVGGLQPVPEGMDMDLASLGEPIACAMYAGMHSGIQLGDTAVVYGMGFAGQIIAQVLKRKGAGKVIGIDVVDGKLELARKLGTDAAINAKREDPVAMVKDLTHGRGVDVVVEAAGTEKAINEGSAMLKQNGIYVFYSWVTTPVTLNIGRWHDDGFEIRTTTLVHHTNEERYVWTPRVLRPVLEGMVDIKPLLSGEFPLSQIKQAFELADRDPSAIKVVVRP
ncbi:MAG: zinc-binding dehydrogenase [Firmicutes bacterium]|nr:zinc-binding dehydrogenase [Bacillota bacterium]